MPNVLRSPKYRRVIGNPDAAVQVDTNLNVLGNLVVTGSTSLNGGTSGPTPIQATAATLVVTAALHAGQIVVLNRAAGIAITLPAATGTGNIYTFIVQTTFTGAASLKVASGTDFFIGLAQNGIDGGTFVPHQYPTANTGTVATESDTLDLFGTANSTGGIKGQKIVVIDIATAVFQIVSESDAAGTEANPWSATV